MHEALLLEELTPQLCPVDARNPCRSRKFPTMPLMPKLAGIPAARKTATSNLNFLEVGRVEPVTCAVRSRTERVQVLV